MLRLLFAIVLLSGLCFAQPVRAPHAQALIDALMAEHQEMQTIGLHITPPGWTDNLNIACSKPGKVGKLSADIDLGVIRTGKPSSRRTEKGAFDMGLPLTDRSGRPIGMVVIVIRETFTKDANVAMKQAGVIRNQLSGRIEGMADLLQGAQLVPSLAAMVVQTPLPGVAGEFGQFAADVAHDRLYLTAPENSSIEVFNLAGDHLRSAPLASAPLAIGYDATRNALLVVRAAESYCDLLDPADFHVRQRMSLQGQPQAGVYDAPSRQFWILTPGFLNIVQPDMPDVTRVPVPTVGGLAMAFDPSSDRVFLPMRDKQAVGVFTRGSMAGGEMKREEIWNVPGLNQDAVLAYDAAEAHLFAAGGQPANLSILDGPRLLQQLDTVKGVRNLWIDSARRRIYVTGIGGLSIFTEDASGAVKLESQFGTMLGAVSYYLPEKQLLFSAHGTSKEDGAGLQVYRMR